MEYPDNLLYTKDHEWVLVEGSTATIGITDYAQKQMGDIVFVELPEKGQNLTKEEAFGVVESVKSVSDCLAPISGEVIDTNDLLKDSPGNVNDDPFGEGWMVKIKLSNSKETLSLMSASDYEAFVKEESE